MQRIRRTSLFMVSAMVCWQAMAATGGRLGQAEVAELEARIGTMYVVRELRLSEKQKEELLVIRREFAPVADEYARVSKAWLEDFGTHLKSYVRHYVRTGQYPPMELQEELDKVHVGGQTRIQFLLTHAAPIVDRFRDVLTDRQRQRLDEIARDPFWLVGGRGMFHRSSQEDLTDPKVSEERRQLAMWQRARWGILTRAGYLCIAPHLEEALGERSSAGSAPWDPGAGSGAGIVTEWYAHVATKLTLLAGLNLDEGQLRRLAKVMRDNVPGIDAAELLHVDLELPTTSSEYSRALRKAEKALDRGRRFSEEDMRELVKIREKGKVPNAKGKPDEEAVAAIHDALEETLSESQMVRMVTGHWCMLPLREDDGTVRAGSVVQDRAAKAADQLDLARKRQDWGTQECDSWWRQQMYVFMRGKEAFERMSESEQKTAVAEAWDTVKVARRLTEEQYVARRDELARTLVMLDRALRHADDHVPEEVRTREGRAPLVRKFAQVNFVSLGCIMRALMEERLRWLDERGGKDGASRRSGGSKRQR